MRDYLLIYINGKRLEIKGNQVFTPLSIFLRTKQALTGTKVVCEEGDCGACTVLLGRPNNGSLSYKPINSCIQFLYQLDSSHIVTIEGLKIAGALNAVQEAMVDKHGAQCGYCTPGIVVSLCAMFDQEDRNGHQGAVNQRQIKNCLTGNLCRCTGYEPIIAAGLEVDKNNMHRIASLYPEKEMIADFSAHSPAEVQIEADGKKLFYPTDIKSAVEFKASHEGAVIVAGGTDVCVFWNKRGIEPSYLMSLSSVPGLEDLKVENGKLIVGARTTLSQLEEFTKDLLPEFHDMLMLFGSPQIRNAGTLAGNIGNGSPIGDSLPFLFVMDAEIELTGKDGARRVNINKFFQGYKKLDMAGDELITSVIIPLPAAGEVLKLYKVSRRQHLDISAFSAAIRLERKGEVISSAAIAFGGAGPVVLRLPDTERFLAGKPFKLETFAEAGRLARGEITPISDVRGSADYRLQLSENILLKFYMETTSEREFACRQ